MSETKAPAIKLTPAVVALTEKLQADLTVDNKTGDGLGGTDAYLRNIPEHVPVEHVKAIREYDDDFATASGNAFLHLTNKAFVSNTDLKTATVTYDMLHGTKVTHKAERERHFPDIRNPDGPGTTNYNTLSTKLTSSVGHNAGDYKKMRDLHKELALASLGKKD